MKVIINGKETGIEIPDNMKLKGNEKIEKIDGKWCKVKYSITENEILDYLEDLDKTRIFYNKPPKYNNLNIGKAIERNIRII